MTDSTKISFALEPIDFEKIEHDAARLRAETISRMGSGFARWVGHLFGRREKAQGQSI